MAARTLFHSGYIGPKRLSLKVHELTGRPNKGGALRRAQLERDRAAVADGAAVCTEELHLGPFTSRPDQTVGLRKSYRELGAPEYLIALVPEQHDCGACHSTAAFDPEADRRFVEALRRWDRSELSGAA